MSLIPILIDWLYPPKCMFCQDILKVGVSDLCDICKDELEFISGDVCPVCGIPKDKPNKACNGCRNMHFSRNYALFLYDGNPREAIKRFKYKPRPQYAKYFGRLLAERFSDGISECDAIVGVPLHKDRERQRGFNQADLLAKEIAHNVDIIHLPKNSLLRVKQTKQQSSLGRHSRHNNIIDAFHVSDSNLFKGKTIALVDDIYTTGATLNECARIIKLAGATQVICISLSISDY